MKKLIDARIKNFWGYGDFSAEAWLIGMEEGLERDATSEHLAERFRAAHGRPAIDMRDEAMMGVYGHARWFTDGAPMQPTWRYPIALYLYLRHSKEPTKEDIRKHQIEKLGNAQAGETMTVEFMPLPSTGAKEDHWRYGSLGISGLSSRAEYLKRFTPERTRKLHDLIRLHQPKLAIFSSLSYMPEWTEIIGVKPEKVTDGMYVAKVGTTVCCVIPHGVARGMSYARIRDYANKIKD